MTLISLMSAVPLRPSEYIALPTDKGNYYLSVNIHWSCLSDDLNYLENTLDCINYMTMYFVVNANFEFMKVISLKEYNWLNARVTRCLLTLSPDVVKSLEHTFLELDLREEALEILGVDAATAYAYLKRNDVKLLKVTGEEAAPDYARDYLPNICARQYHESPTTDYDQLDFIDEDERARFKDYLDSCKLFNIPVKQGYVANVYCLEETLYNGVVSGVYSQLNIIETYGRYDTDCYIDYYKVIRIGKGVTCKV